MAKKNNVISPYVLTAIAVFLLVAGWLMKSFPIFLLAGFAPLFALTDNISEKKPFWNQFEWIWVSLSIGYFAASVFKSESIIQSLVQGILCTLPFIAFRFAQQSLGPRTIKFTVVFLWLALEYVAVVSPWKNDWIYLADGFLLQLRWLTFTEHTGYLGISLWVLTCNLTAYQAFFRGKIHFLFAGVFLLMVATPLALSLWESWNPIGRQDMISLYGGNSVEIENYRNRGEWVARTAAWVSVLIILLSFVKNKTQKK